ncbi:MAG: hypothetical protein H6678_13095 [Candidatus Delongbacteria bacterium]|nr:hypothetical protein [Candidatus Delongbacteria bacterium]
MTTPLLSSEQTIAGSPVWLDTANRQEQADFSQRDERRRREDIALLVYRRRIASLQAERDALRSQIVDLYGEFSNDLKSAQDSSFEQGRESGRAEARQELLAQFTLLQTLEAEMRERGRHQQRDADRELLRFARWMAGRVLGREPGLPGEALKGQIRRLLDYWVGESTYRFRLHPEDRQLLLKDEGLAALQRDLGGRIEWLASPEVPRGSCRLELARGLVEAVPGEMLEELEQVLLEALDAEELSEAELPQLPQLPPSGEQP